MKRLYLDSDGVFAHFNHHVETLFGETPDALGDDRLWHLVTQNETFWHDLPLMHDARVLWEAVKGFNPTFLTGCPTSDYNRAAAAKVAWLNGHFGDHPVITCRSRDKPLHMNAKGDVLVDDFVANIKRWQKAGGVGILHRSAAQTIPLVNAAMKDSDL